MVSARQLARLEGRGIGGGVSIRATNFVRRLRGLSPEEKAVAFVLADHDNHKGEGSYPSMTTVAIEAGLKNRETASRITKRLAQKKIFVSDEPSKREQGVPTVYRPNYALETCDSPVTGGFPQTCDSLVTAPLSKPVTVNCEPVTLKTQTCDSPVTQRVEGLRRAEAVREENSAQHPISFTEVPAKKNHRTPGWVRTELSQDLYRGIHHKKIANAFFDARHLSPREQLAECVRAAVTGLVLARVARLKQLNASEIEKRAFQELLGGLDALGAIADFEVRRQQTTRAVTRVVVEQCERMLERG